MEKSMYKGPWRVPRRKRTPKDPTAPKRPMSAFLAYSNKRRAMVKKKNPDLSNADTSKTLSTMWKEATDQIRQKYIKEELEQRNQYKDAMAAWKIENEKRKLLQRRNQAQHALADNLGLHSRSHGLHHRNTAENTDASHPTDETSVAPYIQSTPLLRMGLSSFEEVGVNKGQMVPAYAVRPGPQSHLAGHQAFISEMQAFQQGYDLQNRLRR